MLITEKEPKPKYLGYYASGSELSAIHMHFTHLITLYSLKQHDPQILKESMDVIKVISKAQRGEDVLRFIIEYPDMNEQLYRFLINTIPTIYS